MQRAYPGPNRRLHHNRVFLSCDTNHLPRRKLAWIAVNVTSRIQCFFWGFGPGGRSRPKCRQKPSPSFQMLVFWKFPYQNPGGSDSSPKIQGGRLPPCPPHRGGAVKHWLKVEISQVKIEDDRKFNDENRKEITSEKHHSGKIHLRRYNRINFWQEWLIQTEIIKEILTLGRNFANLVKFRLKVENFTFLHRKKFRLKVEIFYSKKNSSRKFRLAIRKIST